MDLQLRDRTALVTGASSGIGRAIALELGREGVRLAVTGRRRENLEALAAEIAAGKGVRPAVIVQEALDAGYVEAVASQGLAALGKVEILVNNAGGSRAFTVEATEAQWEEAMTLNFARHRQLTHRLLPQMQANGWGRIINITGKSEPEGINGAFCAKAAIHSWAKGLSREVGRHGITVNCIPPGRVMSDQIRRNYSPEHRQRQSETEIPVGRYGEPEELAALAVFLASPRASYITGAVIPVDGGLRRYQF
jgi:3-oxoacyl-[acyl-carrier protein] reductase